MHKLIRLTQVLLRRLAWLILGLLCAPLACAQAQTHALASPLDLSGAWFELPALQASAAPAQPVKRLSPVGGRYLHRAEFTVAHDGPLVIDFKNSSVLAHFEHRVYDRSGALRARMSGGLASAEINPFFLRHGRELTLPPGPYRLETEVSSPFFLAQPVPYLDGLVHYRQAIKPGNALVLICLGVFVGLGLYYSCLALVRRQRVHAMYAVFIFGNLLYNATALLVAAELFDMRWVYLISVPILLSNMAYVVFVMDLLGISREATPRAHKLGWMLLAVMAGMAALAVALPSWSLEIDRFGVALFLLFGQGVGVLQWVRGNPLARLYLLANFGFFVAGVAAITLLDLQGVYTFYIEHLGLVAVTIEVLLLALVLAYQFGLLQREKASALARAEHNLRLACTDALTGLPNRFALEMALAELPQNGGLTFVDLDGLKHYNDNYGHARGDELLRDFANEFSRRLGGVATLHRLGGDEFAATAPEGDVQTVERLLVEAVLALREAGHQIRGASYGSVRALECAQREQLKHVADTRMYEHKRRSRLSMPAEPEKDVARLTAM